MKGVWARFCSFTRLVRFDTHFSFLKYFYKIVPLWLCASGKLIKFSELLLRGNSNRMVLGTFGQLVWVT